MSNRDDLHRPQRVATPAFLPQRMLAFRLGRGDRQSYVLRDNLKGQSYDFEPWQFFVLEVLPGCTEEERLASVFEDRFGHALDPQHRDMFFASLADAGLWTEAARSHPLVARFCKPTYDVQGEHAVVRSQQAIVAEQAAQSWQPPAGSVPPPDVQGPAPVDRTRVAPGPTVTTAVAPAPAAPAGASRRSTTVVSPGSSPRSGTLVPQALQWQPPSVQQWNAPAGAQWQFPSTSGAAGRAAAEVPAAAPTPAAAAPHSPAPAPAAARKSGVGSPSAVRPTPPKTKIPDDDETLPAGMQGAPDFDPRASRWMWVLFNPTGLLKIATPVLAPLRFVIFALPLLLLGALNVVTRHVEMLQEDLGRLVEGFSLVEHWLISLVSVNLFVTCTTALLAFRYRATVSGFGIALIMRFYPRFALRIGHLDQLSRVERMWLHGAPLLVRMFLFCMGIAVWYSTRNIYEQLPAFALAMSMTAGASFLFSANPLVKSSGYHLLSAFTNEPHLRGKAFKALLGKLRGGSFKEANELLLATYAISMAAFMFVLVAGAASFIGFALHQMYLGGSAIIVATVVGIILARRVLRYFGRVEAAYDRSLQFDRWRKRTHGQDEPKEEQSAASGGFASYIWKAALLTLFVALFLPYEYAAGGPFEVHPKTQQVITTDVSGRIEEVFFEGGEFVPKGTIVARLASTEEQAQAAIFEMKMLE